MGEARTPGDFLKKDWSLWLSGVCLAAGVIEEGFRHLFALGSVRKSFWRDGYFPATTNSGCAVHGILGGWLGTWMTGVSGSEVSFSHLTRRYPGDILRLIWGSMGLPWWLIW